MSSNYILSREHVIHILWWPVCAVSSFRLFAAKRRHTKRRKDEKKKKCQKTKRRNNAMRKDETATRKAEILARKDEKKKPCKKTSFETLIVSSFRVASFRLFARRYFAAKRRKNAMRKDEKKNEITPSLILHAPTSPSPPRFILDTSTTASRQVTKSL